MEFICPVCGNELREESTALKCDNRHSFDKSKRGYVNLLLSQAKKEKRHGDDKQMVQARMQFLDEGYYEPLLQAVTSIIEDHVKPGDVLLDIGCGEGYYTGGIANALQGKDINLFGIDISKNAVEFAAKRCSNIKLSVASAYKVPIEKDICNIIMSLFAPFSGSEVNRVLCLDGIFLRVYPLERHLMELKQCIYDNPYENDVKHEVIDGLDLAYTREVRYKIAISRNEDIKRLFMMTPYYYKTSRKDQEKLDRLTELNTTVEFGIDIYKKGEKV